MTQPLHFLFLEPFFGGSHRDVAEGIVSHSRHRIELVTLPDRFWKWRMRGAALYLYSKIEHPGNYDGILLSSLMSLADLKALWGPNCPPTLVYFHENQLNYPLAPGETHDYQFGFTNISTALTAHRLLFNSHTHKNAFLKALPDFIRMMPDYRPSWITKAVAAKTGVVYPGCHFPSTTSETRSIKDHPPLIIWNHRWEHDKNPDAFFRALAALHHQGIDFRVALLGERYRRIPEAFEKAGQTLKDRIVQWGYVSSRKEYYQWLGRGQVVVSTALQENFGISVVEAMRHGCLPLLPDRLCYPEILPKTLHKDFLYLSQADLEEKLAALVTGGEEYESKMEKLIAHAAQFAWETAIHRFDEELATLAAMGHQPPQWPSVNIPKEMSHA
jgi:glycosyltransferase involved in cell wall biosynthesis